MNYLGIRLDPRLTFWVQIQHAAGKAAKITSQLSRLMANIGGPSQEKRKLLMSTTISVLLYGAEIWADVLKKENRRKVLARVYRTAALRVASAYRTVSGDAILVISGNAPIDLLAYERKKLWELKKMSEYNKSAFDQIKKDTISAWQRRWENERVEDLVGPISANNLISVMMESEANWSIIQKFAETLLRSKKRDLDAGKDM
ncbi:hypothetical protein BBW68_15035 [Candidatus Erwinia dacicola]|uniref:Reverse transcriptase domain-containing protein n=1 Tax=Candidatus Erwinia dacicola TaxID=252393 RepID=A0A1E7YVI6_9GAMM|nr:hypothetical protein [Candidatus Erwinia dacicola]OFC59617.1 hypothetical protein BBW68_15035 [Candidatus Erwinia dacicola]